MNIKSIAQERLSGPEWQRFVAACEAMQEAEGALFEGVADDDAEQIDRAVVDELARRGYLAHERGIR